MSVESQPAASGAGGLESGKVTTYFPCLDAYRAIGMTMVLLIHVEFSTLASDKGPAGPFLDRMDLGLELFFVLSGFLIYRPFVLASLKDAGQVRTGSFLRRRVLRIFPGYWFALTMAVLLFGVPMDSIGDVVIYYGLLQSFDASRLFGGIEQSWSLMTELSFYVMLPIFAAILWRLTRHRTVEARAQAALVGCAVLYLLGFFFRCYVVYADPTWQRQAVLWLPGHLDLFAIGMAFAVVSAWMTRGGPFPAPIRYLSDHPAMAWLIGVAIWVGLSRTAPPDTPGLFGTEYLVRLFLYGVIAAFVLTPAFFGDQSVGRIRHFLSSRVMVYLGTVSLGFYLWHLDILDQIREWMDLDPFHGNFLLLATLTFIGSVIAATVSYFGVERPFLRLKDRPLSTLWRDPSLWWSSSAKH